MKILITLFTALFLVKGCSEVKELGQVEIEYVAETRGYYYAVKIENSKFYATNARNGEFKEVILTKNEWKLLAELFEAIDLNSFETLKGVTNEREFDKKPFGNLYITKNDKKIETRGFDHGAPPKEIQPFVTLILEYAKK